MKKWVLAACIPLAYAAGRTGFLTHQEEPEACVSVEEVRAVTRRMDALAERLRVHGRFLAVIEAEADQERRAVALYREVAESEERRGRRGP